MAQSAVVPGAEAWSARGEGERAAVGVAVVHGFTGNPNSTRGLGERLHSEGYSVEVPLLPGHGTSVRDLGRTRYRDWRATVDLTVDDLSAECEQVVLVGLSMGGTLVLDVSTTRDEVQGVVAINAQILDPTQPLAKVAPLLQHLLPYVPRDLAGLPSDDIAKPGADEQAYSMVSAKAVQSLITQLPGIRARLRDLDVPALVAWSPQDHTVPAANSEALPDLLGTDDVTLLELERSYHVATLDYDAERLEDAVVDFVARVTGT